MRHLSILLLLSIALTACNGRPTTTTSSTKDNEKEHPDEYLKVNYEVHKNLVGKKIIEGTVLNTGKYLTYKSVTLKIDLFRKGDNNPITYTISDAIAPGKQQDFRYKPETNPERVKVSVAAASAD